MTENDVQRAIISYLRAVLPAALVMAIPNAARRTKGGKAGNAVPGLMPGAPDLVVALPDGKTLWLEVKTPVGKCSKEQKRVCCDLTEMGHFTGIVRSIDDVRFALYCWGIDTREATHPAKNNVCRNLVLAEI